METDILNPTGTSLFGPDYGFTEGLPELRTVLQSMSGKMFTRRQRGAGRIYQLSWKSRAAATADALRQWENQFLNDFFSFQDVVRGRYFSGHFQGPLSYSPGGNEQWDIKGIFEELPTLNLFAFPNNWSRDAVFLEERNGFGEDLVKLTGTWTFAADANAHGGSYYSSTNLNTTDKAEWVYFGYGFQLWAQKASNLGILSLSCTRVRDGAVMLAATNVDLYSAGTVASAALNTQTNYPLDLYRVAITATNTKNASSSAKTILADAIQVMR